MKAALLNQAELLARIALLESQLSSLAEKEKTSKPRKRVGKGAAAKPGAKASAKRGAVRGSTRGATIVKDLNGNDCISDLSFDQAGWNFVVEVETEEKNEDGSDGTVETKTRAHRQGTRIGDAQSFAFRALRRDANARVFLCAYFVPHTIHCKGWIKGRPVLHMECGTPELRRRTEVERFEAENFARIEQQSRITKGQEKQFSQVAKAPRFAANVNASAMRGNPTIPDDVKADMQFCPYNREAESQKKAWMKNPMEYRAYDKKVKSQGLKF